MSDDVLTQIGRGELDVGYCIDATPDPAPPPRLPSERSIDGCKFQLAPLLSYTYRVVAPAEWSDKVLGKGWADLAALPWLATPSPSAHRRLLDDVFRPFGPLPKRVGFTDQEEAMIGFVESGVCLSLARDGVLERITRQRDFVIADKVSLACNLSFGCHATPGAGDFAGLCGDAHGVGSEHRQSPRRVDAHGELMTAIDGPIRTSRQDRRSISALHSGDIRNGGALAGRSASLIPFE
jgi:LysR substrate binding domain-containing protein